MLPENRPGKDLTGKVNPGSPLVPGSSALNSRARTVWAAPLSSPSGYFAIGPQCGVIQMLGAVRLASPLCHAGSQGLDQITDWTPGSGLSPVGQCGISLKATHEAQLAEWY